jgi:hypothetical protein
MYSIFYPVRILCCSSKSLVPPKHHGNVDDEPAVAAGVRLGSSFPSCYTSTTSTTTTTTTTTLRSVASFIAGTIPRRRRRRPPIPNSTTIPLGAPSGAEMVRGCPQHFLMFGVRVPVP